MRPLLLALLLAAPVPAADPPSLAKAREAHAAELARLRDQLLADIDAVIRKENSRGAGIDYLLRERKGFAEGGVTPILPKLRPLSETYLAAKDKADEALAVALEKAGRREEAKEYRPKPEKAEQPGAGKPKDPTAVQTASDLKHFLDDTAWAWGDGDMVLRWGGGVEHAGWTKAGLATRWVAIDRRTALLVIEKGRDTNKVAVLMFADDLSGFRGVGFDGIPMAEPKPRRK